MYLKKQTCHGLVERDPNAGQGEESLNKKQQQKKRLPVFEGEHEQNPICEHPKTITQGQPKA